MKENDTIMNAVQCANYLGLSRSALYRLSWQKRIPTIRLGNVRILRFRKADIDKWLTRCTDTPQ
ncbi:MAG: helix-turn-helix domain-containing protein [Planctomycetes bacterium]|nr:helix-turn-helix domain-containing protein [Planctomycetota bacterium]